MIKILKMLHMNQFHKLIQHLYKLNYKMMFIRIVSILKEILNNCIEL